MVMTAVAAAGTMTMGVFERLSEEGGGGGGGGGGGVIRGRGETDQRKGGSEEGGRKRGRGGGSEGEVIRREVPEFKTIMHFSPQAKFGTS